jgi:Lipase (class 3)
MGILANLISPSVISTHSLGAGTSCLLTMYLCVNAIIPEDRKIECFAFAPPPTFFQDSRSYGPTSGQPTSNTDDCSAKVNRAIQNTVAYIHDNDVVPFLSIASVRRLINLLDTVDNETEHIWFWSRWRIFYEYDPIPPTIKRKVFQAEKDMKDTKQDLCAAVDGECNMTIPARRIVWCKHNTSSGKFEAYSCDPEKVAEGNIFLTPDMLSDHLPEQYEDAFDDIVAHYPN